MTENNGREFLLIDESPASVEYFYSFFKKCKLEDKLLHAWNVEEADNILLHEDVTDLKLIIIRFTYSSQAQIDLISKVRKDALLKLIPIVALANSWEAKQASTVDRMVINALVFNPLDNIKFKRIIALAGYTCEDSV